MIPWLMYVTGNVHNNKYRNCVGIVYCEVQTGSTSCLLTLLVVRNNNLCLCTDPDKASSSTCVVSVMSTLHCVVGLSGLRID